MRRLVPCDGGGVGSGVDYLQVGHCVCVVCVSVCECGVEMLEHFVHIYWETTCVCSLNSPSDHSTPFRLLVSC